MGVTTWACPGCGQAQRQEHQNGEAVITTLCAACAEHFVAERDEILSASGAKKEKELQLQLLAQRYGAPEQDARNFAKLCLAEAATLSTEAKEG